VDKNKYIALVIFGCAAALANAASFDCTKARSDSEKLICTGPELSKLDDELARQFAIAKQKMGSDAAFREQTRQEWRRREQTCHDKACLTDWYATRHDELQAALATQVKTQTPENTAPVAAPPPAPSPSFQQVTAPELYAAYHDNEVAADQKYKGRALRIRGIVGSISKDIFDKPYVTLLAGSQFDTVQLQFGDTSNEQLAKLRKGMNIEVTCRGRGMVIGIPVLACGN
jgi:uncharacterized protein